MKTGSNNKPDPADADLPSDVDMADEPSSGAPSSGPITQAVGGAARGAVGLAYGAGELADQGISALGGGTPFDKYAGEIPMPMGYGNLRNYATGPSGSTAEEVGREGASIGLPMLVPGLGEARLASGAVRYGPKVAKAAEYAWDAGRGFLGGALQPSQSGDQTTQGTYGAGAATAAKGLRDVLSRPVGQSALGLGGLALAAAPYIWQHRGGISNILHHPYYLPHALALMAAAIAGKPGAVGAVTGQAADRLGATRPRVYVTRPGEDSDE